MLQPCDRGCRFTVLTDHDVLKSVLNLVDSTGKPAHWQQYLSKLELDVVHCAGMKGQVADAVLH